MKRLIVFGDPGIRKGAIIEHEGERKVCFHVTRNGDWHGPEEVQLWCVIGEEAEREDYQHQNYIPHWLEVETIDAEDVEVIQAQGS